MEDAKKIDFSDRPKEVKNDTWGSSCSFWFFGNEDSADNDLKKKFEICDDLGHAASIRYHFPNISLRWICTYIGFADRFFVAYRQAH